MQKNIYKYCIHSILNEVETNMKILVSDTPFVHIIIWGQHKNHEDPIYRHEKNNFRFRRHNFDNLNGSSIVTHKSV